MEIPNGMTENDVKLVLAKRQFEKLMIQFNELLQDKMLPENKTAVQNGIETDFVHRLVVSANELDVLNPYEGTYGILILLLREGFVMRDNNNRLQYKLQELFKEINKLKIQKADQARAGGQ